MSDEQVRPKGNTWPWSFPTNNHTTRLETLCEIHNQQGGTIHQFDQTYGVDFLAMTENEFKDFCSRLKK